MLLALFAAATWPLLGVVSQQLQLQQQEPYTGAPTNNQAICPYSMPEWAESDRSCTVVGEKCSYEQYCCCPEEPIEADRECVFVHNVICDGLTWNYEQTPEPSCITDRNFRCPSAPECITCPGDEDPSLLPTCDEEACEATGGYCQLFNRDCLTCHRAECMPPPDCSAVSCPAADCTADEIIYKPNWECCGECRPLKCSSNSECPGGFCMKDPEDCDGGGLCMEAPTPEICAANGPSDNVYCGCDGNTYTGFCNAMAAKTTVAFRGACNGETLTEADDSSSGSGWYILSWTVDIWPMLNKGLGAKKGHAKSLGGAGSSILNLNNLQGAYDNMFQVPSVQNPGMNLIEPCDARNSYLFHKLNGSHAMVGGSGLRMPMSGERVADDDMLYMLFVWINEGARFEVDSEVTCEPVYEDSSDWNVWTTSDNGIGFPIDDGTAGNTVLDRTTTTTKAPTTTTTTTTRRTTPFVPQVTAAPIDCTWDLECASSCDGQCGGFPGVQRCAIVGFQRARNGGQCNKQGNPNGQIVQRSCTTAECPAVSVDGVTVAPPKDCEYEATCNPCSGPCGEFQVSQACRITEFTPASNGGFCDVDGLGSVTFRACVTDPCPVTTRAPVTTTIATTTTRAPAQTTTQRSSQNGGDTTTTTAPWVPTTRAPYRDTTTTTTTSYTPTTPASGSTGPVKCQFDLSCGHCGEAPCDKRGLKTCTVTSFTPAQNGGSCALPEDTKVGNAVMKKCKVLCDANGNTLTSTAAPATTRPPTTSSSDSTRLVQGSVNDCMYEEDCSQAVCNGDCAGGVGEMQCSVTAIYPPKSGGSCPVVLGDKVSETCVNTAACVIEVNYKAGEVYWTDHAPFSPVDLSHYPEPTEEPVKEWKFHVYWHQNNDMLFQKALQLRDDLLSLVREKKIAAVFDGVTSEVMPGLTSTDSIPSIINRPTGPHAAPQFEIWVPQESLAPVLSFLALARGQLSILMVPVSRYEMEDYTGRSMWMGREMAVDVSKLKVDLGKIPEYYGELRMGYAVPSN